MLAYSRLLGLTKQQISYYQAHHLYDEINAESKAEAVSQHSGPNASERLTLALIEKAITECEQHGWPVSMLLIDLSPAHESAVKVILARHHVPAIELPDKHQQPDLYYVTDGHWNAAGHRYAAKTILPAITPTLISTR